VKKVKKHIITEAEYAEVKEASKQNTKKRVDKRLQVILLRYEGKKDVEIAQKLDYSRKRVSLLCAEFKRVGLEEYARDKYGGNNQCLTNAEEQEILDGFAQKAAKGEIVTAQKIKAAFDEKRGKDTGRGYIYMVLERHDWRMVMPRGRHPKKASEAEIEASKKLTMSSRK
jgi:transposase